MNANSTNTKFPNQNLPQNTKFGLVLPKIHNILKPSQVQESPIIPEQIDDEEQIYERHPFTNNDDSFHFFDMSFYSTDDIIKYENDIRNIPKVSKPTGVFDVYRYLKK